MVAAALAGMAAAGSPDVPPKSPRAARAPKLQNYSAALALVFALAPEGALIPIGTCFAPQKKSPGSAFRPAMGKLPIVMGNVNSSLTNCIIRIVIDPSGSKDNGRT